LLCVGIEGHLYARILLQPCANNGREQVQQTASLYSIAR